MRLMPALTWLAMRELWMSFRLLTVLGLLLSAGALTALLPSTGQASITLRFGVALGVASVAAAMLAAATFAAERRRGTTAWLVARAVPRSALLGGWFIAFGGVLVGGLLPGAVLAWLTLTGTRPAVDPVVFWATVIAAATGALVALSIGLLSGALLPPVPAAAACLVACGAAGSLALLSPAAAALSPLGGYALLAALPDSARPLASALQSIGIALAITAVLLVAARLAFERIDL